MKMIIQTIDGLTFDGSEPAKKHERALIENMIGATIDKLPAFLSPGQRLALLELLIADRDELTTAFQLYDNMEEAAEMIERRDW